MSFITTAFERFSHLLREPGEDATALQAYSSRPFDRRTTYAILALILLAAAVFLLPILQTPFLGDETWDSYFKGVMGYERWSPLEWFLRYNGLNVSLGGRFDAGVTLIEFLKFTLTQSALTLKICTLIGILINIATFFALLRNVLGTRVALLASLVVITTLQVRVFYEPITEITVTFQVILELILLSTIAAFAYAARPNRRNLAISAFLYFVSCGTYEICYPFLVLYVAIAAAYAPSRAAMRAAVWYCAVLLIFILLNIGIRFHTAVGPASEYYINSNPIPFLVTLFYQTSSALPATYIFANPNGVFAHRFAMIFGASLIGVVVAAGVFVLATSTLVYRRNSRAAIGQNEPIRWRMGTLLSVSFIVLPALLICLSPRWQHELKFGLPYHPAYVEGYGWSLLIVLAIERTYRMARIPVLLFSASVSACIGLATLCVYAANANVYPRNFPAWKYPYRVLVDSLERGGFGAIPNGSTVLSDTDYAPHIAVETGWFSTRSQYEIFLFTGRRVQVRLPRAGLDAGALCSVALRAGVCARAIPNLYYYRLRSGATDGTSQMLHVTEFNASDIANNVFTMHGDRGILYEESDAIANSLAADPTSPSVRWTRLVDRDNYRLYLATARCGTLIDESSLEGGSAVSLSFGDGFYAEETNAGIPFHWAQARATFNISNESSVEQKFVAEIHLATLSPGRHTVTLDDGVRRVTIAVSPEGADYKLRGVLRPNGKRTVELSSDAPHMTTADPRDLRVRVYDFDVQAEGSPCRSSATDRD